MQSDILWLSLCLLIFTATMRAKAAVFRWEIVANFQIPSDAWVAHINSLFWHKFASKRDFHGDLIEFYGVLGINDKIRFSFSIQISEKNKNFNSLTFAQFLSDDFRIPSTIAVADIQIITATEKRHRRNGYRIVQCLQRARLVTDATDTTRAQATETRTVSGSTRRINIQVRTFDNHIEWYFTHKSR